MPSIYPFIIPLQVYATKDGKELTGRSAYRQYRKVHQKTSYIIDDFGVHFMSLNAFEYTCCWLQESGAGVRKSKKKTSAKKKKG